MNIDEKKLKEPECPLCEVSQETIEKLKKGKPQKEKYLLKKQEKEKERLLETRSRKIKKMVFIFLPILLIGGGIVFALLNFSPNSEKINKPKATFFYSPTCGCCREYILYLKRQGFEVEEKPTEDMLAIKEQYQIPSEMESCHTAVIGDYFIEGHMPIEAIKKLLAEKPDILGIGLPGMPQGSPGMGGLKKEVFKIYGLSRTLALYQFMVY